MLWEVTLPVLSGILYSLSFPPFNFSLLAWIALVPLILSLRGGQRPSKQSLDFQKLEFASPASGGLAITFVQGLLTGVIANLIIFFWIWATFNAAKIGFLTTLGCWLSLALILGTYFGLFALGLSFIRNPWLRPWFGGALWVCLEHIRSFILTGFPWATLSQTQVHNLPLIQIASLTGAPAISFIIVAVNVTLADCVLSLRGPQISGESRHSCESRNLSRKTSFKIMFETWMPAFAGMTKNFVGVFGPVFAVLLSVFIFGFIRVSNYPPATSHLKAAILQGNIDQYKKWDAQYEAEVRTTYENLAQKSAQSKPNLIIWPESAVPGWFPNDKFYAEWVQKVVKETKTYNIVGACSSSREGEFNSAFLLSPEGEILNQYSKIHLVPFGEYIPFGRIFKKWVPYLGELGAFTPGTGEVIFKIKSSISISTNICYEAIFAGIIRNCVKEGADIIVNLTNDGWFLKTGAPEQHFNANILRAVENARPVVRAANTGISGVIDPTGRILLKTPLMETVEYSVEVPIANPGLTFYTRWGEWFTILCWAGIIAGLILKSMRRKDLRPEPASS